MRQRLTELALLPVSARPVALSRILVGTAAALEAVASWPRLTAVLAPGTVPVPFSAMIPRLPAPAAPWFMALWLAAAVAFAAGWRTCWAGGLLAALIGYHLVLDQQTYSNHGYLMFWIIVLLLLADCEAAWSLDARRTGSRDAVPGWPVFLLRAQLTITYAFAVISKLNLVYVSGGVLVVYLRREYGPLVLPDAWLDWRTLMPLALLSIVIEAFLVVGFWVPRWRRAALLAGIALHGVIPIIFIGGPGVSGVRWLIVFGLAMASLYALFWATPQGGSAVEPVVRADAVLVGQR